VPAGPSAAVRAKLATPFFTGLTTPDGATAPEAVVAGGVFGGAGAAGRTVGPGGPGGAAPGGGAATGAGGSNLRLGMYVVPDASIGSSMTIGGGGYVARNSGFGLTDTAGLVAAGALAPGFRETGAAGGVLGSYDASHLTGANQRLIFSGLFNYTTSNAKFGSTPALTALGINSAGRVERDVYGFGGSVLYAYNNFYALGKGTYEVGRGREFQTIDQSSGKFDSEGYSADLRIGHVFMLLDTTRAAAPGYAKAPVKAESGYALGLDVSGHVGYQSMQDGGFTDSVGFTFGTERVRFGTAGGQVKLIASIQDRDLTWMPYISGTVDQQFDFRHTSFIPVQAALATGDVITFSQGNTFWGGQLGLDIRGLGGVVVGFNGFYASSSDTEIAGGRAYVKVPLGGASTTRY
jgi:hypothetical protein